MQKNTTITIKQVSNGFIIGKNEEDADGFSRRHVRGEYVFQSTQELINFLVGHFDHRAYSILDDKDIPAQEDVVKS